ncbi:endothelin-converting enzyme 2 isoform X2 [Vigna radiata var. radiata]|uniref:Endothelin-converting enzyme 2 isoform X2 n=1 Tax=Vigna radiata var. radiata TaxID=3916 RepID=A0A3Q0EYA1_VIGRR|nr:endothelin-converting enzyme 2 isoform X2 [Vigna radiata var. radiata]
MVECHVKERVMTSSTQVYGEPWYWDNRYTNEPGPFDWYQKYITLAPIISLYVPPTQRILIVGCGNSAFSEGMVVDGGYTDVVNIDISSVVIEAMKSKYRDFPQLKYVKMDVRNMSDFESESFDAAIDKGTLDSILVTYGAPLYRLRLLRESCSWTIKLHVIEKLASEEKSDQPVWELTKPVPLNDDGTSVEEALGRNPDVHYIYICTKEISANSNTKP